MLEGTASTRRLGLGTAQFGLDYGIANAGGKVPEAEVAAIVATARAAGMSAIDTAPVYGDSEGVLGRVLAGTADGRIVTKTPAFAAERIGDAETAAMRRSVETSLARLGRPRVYGVLHHGGRDFAKPGGERIAANLEALKHDGLTDKIGVSVYTAAELDAVLARFTPDLVQLPLSIADQRLLRSGHIAVLKERNVEIHVRSVFLQGLLLMERSELPGELGALGDFVDALTERARAADIDRLTACLGFCLARPEVDTVVVGVLTRPALRAILAAAEAAAEVPFPADLPELEDPRLLDPRSWPPRPVPPAQHRAAPGA